MRDLPLDHRSNYQTLYDCALRVELLGMLAGALVVDPWWRERVSLIPDSTFEFLRRASLEEFPGIILTEGSETGTLPLDAIVANIEAV